MKFLKKIFYYYSNFSGKAGKLEYFIYISIQFLSGLVILYLSSKIKWIDRTIINLFYINLIFLLTFIPFQAVTTRRLRDLNISINLVVLNFIPIINILFKIYLTFASNENSRVKMNINEGKRINNFIGEPN